MPVQFRPGTPWGCSSIDRAFALHANGAGLTSDVRGTSSRTPTSPNSSAVLSLMRRGMDGSRRQRDPDTIPPSPPTRCSAAGQRAPIGTGARRNAEQGPHLWGCDRGGVHEPAPLLCGCTYRTQNPGESGRDVARAAGSTSDFLWTSRRTPTSQKLVGGPEPHCGEGWSDRGGNAIRTQSCRRDQHYPRSSAEAERAVTAREVEGSIPSGGAICK